MTIVGLPDPLTLPTWLTAIFTGVLAAGAIVAAVFAILAFRKQSAEVSLLQEQALQQAGDRRRSRAALVYVTVGLDPGLRGIPDMPLMEPREPSVVATVHNTGEQPIYDVRVHWVDGNTGAQGGAEEVLGTIKPADVDTARRMLPAGTTERYFVAVVYFRDAAGVRWTLLPDGELDEVDPALPAGAPAIAMTAVAHARAEAGVVPSDRT